MPIALSRVAHDADALEVKESIIYEDLPINEHMSSEDGGFAKRTEIIKEDINDVQYRLPVYNIFMFKKEMPVILFYLANGAEWALDFLGVSRILSFESNMDNREDNEIWFPISAKCFLRVKDKDIFNKYRYIQSVVGGILSVVTNRFTPDHIKDRTVWVKKLGNGNNYAKGLDMLTFFTRLLDETTKKVLLLDDYHKKDIYSLIRWMMMNFDELRLKDNMNLYNKRIRCNEYISSLLTIEFSKRLNRVVAMGNKATMDNYREIFKFPGEILLQKMHVSGVLRFDDVINDMNFFSKFKITSKGPHSQGAHDSNRISMKARGIHPSYLENFDILVCGSSDPGSTALLSPWGGIKGFHFDSTPEEDNFLFEFKRDMDEYDWEHSKTNEDHMITITSETKERYFEVLNNMSNINMNIKVFGTSKDDPTLLFEGEEDVDKKEDDEKDTQSEE